MTGPAHNPPDAVSSNIRRLTPGQRPAALERLALGGGGPDARQVERFLDFARRPHAGQVDFWGWIGPRGTLEHAVLIVPRPGRTGMCFVSRPRRRGHVDQLAAVIRAAVADVPAHRAALVQGLIETTDDLKVAALEAAGFEHLATLSYLHRAVGRDEPHPAPPDEAELLGWDESRRALFVEAMEASYRQTLDCPRLHGLRRPDDVLAGHMAAGRFDGDLWTLVRLGGRSAAVLLLAEVPDQRCVELVYLGVTLEHRRRGLGQYLMRRAMALTAERGWRTLTLAVDDRNEPAMALYRSMGLRRFARRIALALPIDAAPNPSGDDAR